MNVKAQKVSTPSTKRIKAVKALISAYVVCFTAAAIMPRLIAQRHEGLAAVGIAGVTFLLLAGLVVLITLALLIIAFYTWPSLSKPLLWFSMVPAMITLTSIILLWTLTNYHKG